MFVPTDRALWVTLVDGPYGTPERVARVMGWRVMPNGNIVGMVRFEGSAQLRPADLTDHRVFHTEHEAGLSLLRADLRTFDPFEGTAAA